MKKDTLTIEIIQLSCSEPMLCPLKDKRSIFILKIKRVYGSILDVKNSFSVTKMDHFIFTMSIVTVNSEQIFFSFGYSFFFRNGNDINAPDVFGVCCCYAGLR